MFSFLRSLSLVLVSFFNAFSFILQSLDHSMHFTFKVRRKAPGDVQIGTIPKGPLLFPHNTNCVFSLNKGFDISFVMAHSKIKKKKKKKKKR